MPASDSIARFTVTPCYRAFSSRGMHNGLLSPACQRAKPPSFQLSNGQTAREHPCRVGMVIDAKPSYRDGELDPKEAFPVGLGTDETHHDRPFGSNLRMRTFDSLLPSKIGPSNGR